MKLLTVDNIGKEFHSYHSNWRRFAGWLGVPVESVDMHWVLRHVSFELQPGEALGIIGRNGAGKSTLLKIIAGIMTPTQGRVSLEGSVAAILELGMGFNPELTGRQNAAYTAGLMGLSKKQVQQAMPQIEAFAEIGDYFDRPLRTCSSGMQMRVAFSVATAHRPDILIIDEAFSVGDTYFQHKSFNRIRQFQEQGSTLLIVSHDRNAILSICNRAILLDFGSVINMGAPEAVFDFYNALIAEKEHSTVRTTAHPSGKTQTISGTGEACVQQVQLCNSNGEDCKYVAVGEQVSLRVRVKVHQDVESLVLGYGIKDRFGQVMYGTNTWHTKQVVRHPRAGDEYLFDIAFDANLGVGSYSIQTALSDRETHLTANYEWRDMAVVFDVVNKDKTRFAGCLWSEPQITVKAVSQK